MPRQYNQGLFRPKNPYKYKGDVNNIVYRSSWEKRFLTWCDENPSIVEYSSEETIVPYICETDSRMHRYFIDAWVKVKDKDGKLSEFIVEIKPWAQTQPPKYPGKQTKRYLEEVETFVKNQSKWAAAKKYAAQRGWQFIILTEKELFQNGKPK